MPNSRQQVVNDFIYGTAGAAGQNQNQDSTTGTNAITRSYWPFVQAPEPPVYTWVDEMTTYPTGFLVQDGPPIPKKEKYLFKVGDKVLLPQDSSYNTRGDFTGTILRIESTWIVVAFEPDFFQKYDIHATEYRTWKEKLLPLPKDYKKLTRLERKCKKLWNESNWVKKNPQFGY